MRTGKERVDLKGECGVDGQVWTCKERVDLGKCGLDGRVWTCKGSEDLKREC